MIEKFFLPKLGETNRFEQDGTTAHSARISMKVLWKHFPESVLEAIFSDQRDHQI